MPPNLSKKRKAPEKSSHSAPKKTTTSNTRTKREPSLSDNGSESDGEIVIASTNAVRQGKSGKDKDSKDKKKGNNKGNVSVQQSHSDWLKLWADELHPEVLKDLWKVRERNTGPVDGSVFVVSFHLYGQYADPEAKVLGVYTTAAAANEFAIGYLLDKPTINAAQMVGPEDCSAIRKTGRVDADDSYWSVDGDGCWHLHGDEETDGSFDLRVQKRVVNSQPPARKSRDTGNSEESD